MNLTTLTITAVILVMIGLDVNQATPEARIPRTIRTNETISITVNSSIVSKSVQYEINSQQVVHTPPAPIAVASALNL